MASQRIPVATYRVQFNRQFGFQDAAGIVPYLHKLGASELCASPIYQARPGSAHGYDVTDPTRLNPDLGTESDFEALVQTIKRHNIGLLLDIVPNHMAAVPENPWWADVTEKGASSPYANYFDINWEQSGERLSYRRFFDINELVGVRVEAPEVFEATHSLILRLIKEGRVTGLRIDHIDGLYDPLAYLLRLQSHIAADETGPTGFYIVVEKILASGEELLGEWPVAGTTGYDFLNSVNALFIDNEGLPALDKSYTQFNEATADYSDVVYRKKKLVMERLFPGELETLGGQLARLASQDRTTADLPEPSLTATLMEVAAGLPVYRTYIRGFEVPARDRNFLEAAFQEAEKRHNIEGTALDFVRRVLFLDFPPDSTAENQQEWLRFTMRWQQWTGAVMAKGFEDTALYNYHRLASLNEVGGDPSLASVSPETFHHLNKVRQEHWPHTMNATSTHDTKRSEDVRARINVLSEIPLEWQEHVVRWHRWNEPKKRIAAGRPVPEPNTEYLLYQTMAGAWPLLEEDVPDFRERLKDYAIKAVREAKVFTGWQKPNQEYERALVAFLDNILDNSNAEFLEDFRGFQGKIAWYGALNSLGQVLLKITSPGVPDFYQGTELWDFSLVDPDNRRPVDFKRRMELLDNLMRREELGKQLSLAAQLLASWQDGRVKLYVTYRALNVRQSQPDLFRDGDYQPLPVKGQRQAHICAFARRWEDAWTLTVVPRCLTGLVPPDHPPVGRQVWADDFLQLPPDAPERWRNVFTGEDLPVPGQTRVFAIGDILGTFPVALLTVIR